MSIINFLVYFNKRVIFSKSVNASNKIRYTNYIGNLIDTVVEGIGPLYIVHIMIDNEANFKKVGL